MLCEKMELMLACTALLMLAAFFPGGIFAAENNMEDMGSASSAMKAAEKEFKEAEDDFVRSSQANPAQKTGTHSWSDVATQISPSTSGQVTPKSMSDPANPALHGSPQTGYAGTWTDPATGDIITSVIAPTPRQNDYSQNYPIIIEPNVGSWNSGGGSGVIWNGNNPQWPTTPDNPGWGNNQGWGNNPGAMPPPPPGPGMAYPGQNFYPSPPLPPNFHPGYRPLVPNQPSRPPAGNGQNWGQGNNPGWNQGITPGWNPGWNQGNNPGFQPGSNRPGWNPGANPGWNPGANQGFPGGNRPGWNPGGNGWGGNVTPGMGARPWRGNP